MRELVIYLNGRFVPKSAATISVTDRGFLFGDGLFTTVRVKEGEPEHLERHLTRLRKQSEEIGIQLPSIPSEAIEELIDINGAKVGIWRMKIIVTGGDSPELRLKTGRQGTLLATLEPFHFEAPDPCRLAVYPHRLRSPISKYKTLSYLERLHIKEYALEQGCFDALVLSPEGFILETAFANVYWMLEGELYYPDPKLPYLEGVMLSAIREGRSSRPVSLPLEELPKKADLYLCNAMIGSLLVNQVLGSS